MIRVSVVRGCWMETVVKSVKWNVVMLHTGTKTKNTHPIGLHADPTRQFTETQTRWHNDSHRIYISIILSTGSAGQPLCRRFCSATVTNHSWGTGSSGANESHPHMICHYIAANRAYYWWKRAQLCLSEEAEEIEEKSICHDRIMSRPDYRYNN